MIWKVYLGKMPTAENIWYPVQNNKLDPQVSAQGKGRRQCLLVDDDEDDMLFFETAINELKIDCDLHHVTSGDNMFQILNHITPDLIFLDLRMPGKSGLSCLKMLRYQNVYDRVPIIIYSNCNKPSFIHDCYAAKANYYIIKPLTIPKICEALNKVFTQNWDLESYPLKEDFLIAFEPGGQSMNFSDLQLG